jgi:hypothetical protein
MLQQPLDTTPSLEMAAIDGGTYSTPSVLYEKSFSVDPCRYQGCYSGPNMGFLLSRCSSVFV